MKTLLIVDLAGVFFQNWHGSAHAEINTAYRVTIDKCREIMTEWRGVSGGYDAVAWCVDAPPYKRLSIRSDYKANRERPDARAIEQYRQIQEWLKAQGELVLKSQGYESDDLIATLCAQATEDVGAIDILSSDKDLLQLVSDRVNVLPTRKDSAVDRYDPSAVFDRYGITPAQFVDYLAICGDKTDNVPGIKGLGPKIAAQMLNTIGNIDAILEAAKDIGDKRIATPAKRTLINNSYRELMESRRLVQLMTDAPIRFDEIWEERERQDVEPPPEDDDAVAEDADHDDAPPEDDVPPELGKPPAAKAKPAATPPPAEQPEPQTEPAKATGANGSNGAPKPNGHTNGNGSAHNTGAGATGGQGAHPPAGDSPDEDEPQRPAAQAAKPSSVSLERAEFALTYEPNSRKVAWWLATRAADSRVFPGVANPAQAYMILQVGRELGLTAMASLRGIKMVKGQPMVMSTLLVGIILQSGLAEYFECRETTATKAVYATRRKGRPTEQILDYTIEEARAADLLRKSQNGEPSNYEKRPKTMLRHRAAAELARMVYPEIVSGVYVFGEDMGDGVEHIDVSGVEVMA